jgi:hypothetical protein
MSGCGKQGIAGPSLSKCFIVLHGMTKPHDAAPRHLADVERLRSLLLTGFRGERAAVYGEVGMMIASYTRAFRSRQYALLSQSLRPMIPIRVHHPVSTVGALF